MGERASYLTLRNFEGKYPVVEELEQLKEDVNSLSDRLTCCFEETDEYPVHYRLKCVKAKEAAEPYEGGSVSIPNFNIERFFRKISRNTEPFYTLVRYSGFPSLGKIALEGEMKGHQRIILVYAEDGEVKTAEYDAVDAIEANWGEEVEKLR